MKTKYIITTIFLILFTISGVLPAYSQEEGSATQSSETIKENVKKRIQEVVSDKADSVRSILNATSYLGTLTTRTNNTLTIESEDGVILASTSATTTFVRLPDNEEVDIEDLTIDEYIIALGFVNGDEVLNARRVIIQSEPPEPPEDRSFFGAITDYDSDEYLLSVENPNTAQESVFIISRNANISIGNPDGTKDELNRTDQLPIGNQVIVIYTPVDDEDEYDIAINILIRPNGNDQPSP